MQSAACGKIILFGEHAVVYGRPAIAAPVTGISLTVSIEDADRLAVEGFGDGRLAARAAGAILRAFERSMPIKVTVESTIPISAGLGSSAAFCVALTKALAKHLGRGLEKEAINEISLLGEEVFHAHPSGVDNTVITYEKTVFFRKGAEPEFCAVKEPLHIIIANTCFPSSTKDAVRKVREAWKKDRGRYEGYFEGIGSIVIKARAALEKGSVSEIANLMNQNHEILRKTGVSHESIETAIAAARKAGARGAKLSGAGFGGNIIALVDEGQKEDVSSALRRAGLQVIQTVVS